MRIYGQNILKFFFYDQKTIQTLKSIFSKLNSQFVVNFGHSDFYGNDLMECYKILAGNINYIDPQNELLLYSSIKKFRKYQYQF